MVQSSPAKFSQSLLLSAIFILGPVEGELIMILNIECRGRDFPDGSGMGKIGWLQPEPFVITMLILKKVSKHLGLHVFYRFLLGLGGIRILLKKIYIFPLIDSNNENLLGTEYCGSNLPTNYFRLFKTLTNLNLNKALYDSD